MLETGFQFRKHRNRDAISLKYRVRINYRRILQNHIFRNTEQKYMQLLASNKVPLPKTLPELRERIYTAIGNVTQDMLERVWREWEYRLDICRVTRGAHIECIYFHSSSSSSVMCQTTVPKPLPKRFLHVVWSRASSFNWQYPLLSLRSSSSFLRLLPRLLVTFKVAIKLQTFLF